MRYSFPVLETIDPILRAIDGREEFGHYTKVDERTGARYAVIDYNVAFADTFPFMHDEMTEDQRETAILRREIRGLIYDPDTRAVLRRPLHKFFNAGERPEVAMDRMDMSEAFAMAKLDGSMIAPFMVGDHLLFGTRAGVTDVSEQAWRYLYEKVSGDVRIAYFSFIKESIRNGFTPVFEWCSRQNRVVLDHPEASLTLLHVRNIRDGSYATRQLINAIRPREIPLVPVEDISGFASMSDFHSHVKGLTGVEGFVVSWPDGHATKLKCDWYCRIHDVKEKITFEKNVIDLILTGQMDDVMDEFTPEDRDRVERYSTDLRENLASTARRLEKTVADAKLLGMSKKDFAMAVNQSNRMKIERGLLFAIFDGKKAFDVVLDKVRTSLSTATRVDEIRPLIGGIDWYKY